MNQEQDVMTQNSQKNTRKTKLVWFPLILVSVIVITATLTTFTLYATSDSEPFSGDAPEEFDKFFEIYNTIINDYYEDVDKEALIESAIEGLLDGLDDPYTEYMDSEEMVNFQESVTGDFEGIGAEVRQEGSFIIVTSPMRGSPAEKAGVEPGDIITAVDGESIEGWTTNEAVQLIRGEKGTDVELTIVRGNNDPFEITITRDTIHVESVTFEMLDDIAYISINRFQQGTNEEFGNALDQAASEGATDLIIDFRYNPGGLLNEAVSMINQFVDRNTTALLIQDSSGDQVPLNTVFSKNDSTEQFENIYLMMNEGSASASEVFTGALIDLMDVEVVGTESFGKGTVQTTREFGDNSMIKYTNSKWLTPNGTWVDGEGITPDVELINPDYYRVTIINPEDIYSEDQTHETVLSIKVALDALGYEIDTFDENFDAELTEAVESFQEDNDLEVDGVMTGETTDELLSQLRTFIFESDAQLDYLLDYINGEYSKEEIEALAQENAQYIEVIDIFEEASEEE